MTSIEIRKQALEREEYRMAQLADATKNLPKNKSGRFKSGEANMLISVANQAHKTLCHYDVVAEPPPLAGVTETWFDACVERLADLGRQAASSSTPTKTETAFDDGMD